MFYKHEKNVWQISTVQLFSPPAHPPHVPFPPFSLLKRTSLVQLFPAQQMYKQDKSGLKLSFSGPKSLPSGKASLPVWIYIPF